MNTVPIEVYLSESFGLDEKHASIKPIGSGHINTTMLLSTSKRSLVVQKLNTVVFPKPQLLVDNARLIEQHLSKKQQAGEFNLAIVRHVATTQNDYLVNNDDDTWRALEFIGGSYSEDVVNTASQAQTAANAFGQFAQALQDFDANNLHAVIPNFHNLPCVQKSSSKWLAPILINVWLIVRKRLIFACRSFHLSMSLMPLREKCLFVCAITILK